jgi:GlpG protein
MIWLWVLGRPIEQRIGAGRTLLLTFAAAIASNVVQYLMSGPLFLGYSGVVMGLAGFIWMRERIAPWEGYPVQKGTMLFLGFFILAMFVLQSLSFFVQIFSDLPFILSIANTAHIAGAIVGMLLGRLSLFARS